jgi:predicted TIM-barrel fold metal-dependent hydrolase
MSPPEYMVSEMDAAGVDVAVLQNTSLYGKLNDYISECIRQYPERFIGLARIEEAYVDNDAQLIELHRCTQEAGLQGLFFTVGGFWRNAYSQNLDDTRYNAFWDEVTRLGLVVY